MPSYEWSSVKTLNACELEELAVYNASKKGSSLKGSTSINSVNISQRSLDSLEDAAKKLERKIVGRVTYKQKVKSKEKKSIEQKEFTQLNKLKRLENYIRVSQSHANECTIGIINKA